jgi:hypothetical protein
MHDGAGGLSWCVNRQAVCEQKLLQTRRSRFRILASSPCGAVSCIAPPVPVAGRRSSGAVSATKALAMPQCLLVGARIRIGHDSGLNALRWRIGPGPGSGGGPRGESGVPSSTLGPSGGTMGRRMGGSLAAVGRLWNRSLWALLAYVHRLPGHPCVWLNAGCIDAEPQAVKSHFVVSMVAKVRERLLQALDRGPLPGGGYRRLDEHRLGQGTPITGSWVLGYHLGKQIG